MTRTHGEAPARHRGPAHEFATTQAAPSALSVPDLAPDTATLTAALTYADAGWHVVPVRRGTKNPGSVLGGQWQHQSSRDPQQIAAWFAAEDYGVVLHAGRSGAVVFDLDHPERVPDVLAAAIQDHNPPRQRTRTTGERGHVVFGMPPGRLLGNSTGRLGKGWGEVRGASGVIVVAPSEHPEPGGQYRWSRTGPVPVLPEAVAALLPDAGPASEAATDARVEAFLAEHVQALRPTTLPPVLDRFTEQVAAGGSRHDAALEAACWAAREAAAGFYPAAEAFRRLGVEFAAALRGERPAAAEFAGIVAWAVAQVTFEEVEAKRSALQPADRDSTSGTPALAAPADEGAAPRASWLPLDLNDVLDGTARPAEPTLLPRADGRCLLYPGKVHSVHGESESGKSLLLHAETARLLLDGQRVVILDWESNAQTVVGRLLLMGAPREAIRGHLGLRPARGGPHRSHGAGRLGGPAGHPRRAGGARRGDRGPLLVRSLDPRQRRGDLLDAGGAPAHCGAHRGRRGPCRSRHQEHRGARPVRHRSPGQDERARRGLLLGGGGAPRPPGPPGRRGCAGGAARPACAACPGSRRGCGAGAGPPCRTADDPARCRPRQPPERTSCPAL
jgi:hypothetical protein